MKCHFQTYNQKKKGKKKSYGKFTISLELLEWLDAKKPIYPNFKERQ